MSDPFGAVSKKIVLKDDKLEGACLYADNLYGSCNFKLLLENDQVRVLKYTLLPGSRDRWHTHPPRVGHVLSGATIRVTRADGSHTDYDEKTGDTYWGPFSPLHDTQNIGTTPYVALLVEVKGAPAVAGADPE